MAARLFERIKPIIHFLNLKFIKTQSGLRIRADGFMSGENIEVKMALFKTKSVVSCKRNCELFNELDKKIRFF